MTYFIFRVPILLIICCACLFIKIKKYKIPTKVQFIFIASILLITSILLKHLELEENYVEFKTPTSAFNYSYPFKDILVTDNNDKCYAIMYYDDNNSIKFAMSHKLKSGNWSYIYPRGVKLKHEIKLNYDIYLYDENGCSFVSLSNRNFQKDDKPIIKDNKGNLLKEYKDLDNDFKFTHTSYYTFIDNKKDFYIQFNNEIIYLNMEDSW